MTDQPLTIASWNILLDTSHGERVAPQFARLPDIIETLGRLGPIDVAGLLEVEESQNGHHGRLIAGKLGYEPGAWRHHSRSSEHIGMFGAAVENVEFFDIGYKKQMAVTQLGEVAVAALHLKRPHNRQHLREQAYQMTAALERLEGADRAVIMGDFNTIPYQPCRRLIEAQGFRSALPRFTQTVPTNDYCHIVSPRERRAAKLARGILKVDDIYVRGLTVRESGTLVGDSDHKLVYARLNQPDT